MSELQSVVLIRKNLLINREIAALAKVRNVTINEICMDELERKELINIDNQLTENLNQKSLIKIKNNESKEMLSQCVLGKLPNTNDLEAILRLRKNFTIANKNCLNFGDFSDNE